MSELNGNRGLWGPVWAGLVDDPRGKHAKRMGKAVWLYLYLIIHSNWETGRLVRTYETISNDMGIPDRTLKDWMSVLKKFKYVVIVRNPHSLSIQITKWEGIKRKMRSAEPRTSENDFEDERSAENRVEKCEPTYSEVQNPASSASSRTSVNDSKIKDKCERSAEPRTSNEILNESINEINKGKMDGEICFEEDWVDFPMKNGANKSKAKSCYKKTVANNLKTNRPKFQQKTKAYIEDCKASNRFLKNAETWFRNWQTVEVGPGNDVSGSPFDDPEVKRNNELNKRQMQELQESRA